MNENQIPKHNEHKSIAYTMKEEQQVERQKNQKLLRVIRAHEKRLDRIEQFLKITPSDKELIAFGSDKEDDP